MSSTQISINPELKRQLAIKGWILGILVFGFLVSIVIPKLAISRLGEVGYGVYALIVGFSAVLGFADLGLVPGLIRGLARPIAMGNWAELKARLSTIDRVVFGAFVLLITGCALLMYWSLPSFKWKALHALLIFAAAMFLYIRADIRSAMLRVSGAVTTSYMFRGLYLVTYLSTAVMLYLLVKIWDGVWVLCCAQLFASCIYYLSVKFYLRRKFSTAQLLGPEPSPDDRETKFWREAWRVSSPERMARFIQLITGAVERPLLLATAGLAMVTSYDLLMRLVLLVSAVPGALNHPLLAMLAHDSVRESQDRRFPMALRLTKIASAACALAGLVVCTVLWAGFHQAIFRVPSRIPLAIGILVAAVAAINIQTAPESAALTAEGVVRPMNIKLYVEGAGILAGGMLAYWMKSGLLFIVVRYSALGLSAIGFLVFRSRTFMVTHEQQEETCCVSN